jgi:hypothetical protein
MAPHTESFVRKHKIKNINLQIFTSFIDEYNNGLFYKLNIYLMGHDSSVCIVTDYGQDGSGAIPSRSKIFSSPQRPDQLWGSTSLISNAYWG